MPQLTIQQAFALALQHHQSGRVQQAEDIYRQILAQQPGHADAQHLLGVIAYQAGKNSLAIDLIRQAIAIKSDFPEAYSNLGAALSAMGQLDEAIAAFHQAIALNSQYPAAYNNLGNALKKRGQLDEAVAAFRKAIAIKPSYAEAYSNLSTVLKDKGFLEEAVAVCRQAIALDANSAVAYNNLGAVLRDNGQLDEAIAAFRQSISSNPSHPEAHKNLGDALRKKGYFDQAIAACRQAISLDPSYPEAYSNLGAALRDKDQLEEAIAAFRQAITLQPHLAEPHNHLANALKDKGKLDEAIATYRQAISLNPQYAEAHSNLLLTLYYHPYCEAKIIAEEHRRWEHQHSEPLQNFIQSHSNGRSSDRRLKIGYVSHDLRRHSVAFFLLPLMEAHDRQQFHITCYATSALADLVTERFRACSDDWCSLADFSDEQAAQRIRHDRIDILVDLNGHTAGNRLLLFARKAAPIQITYLGFPGSTGLRTIDYRLTDAFADPPSIAVTDTLPTEQLIRLPETAWSFTPLSGSPPVTELPALRNGYITFGSFNNLAKVTPPTLEMWSLLLQRVPSARLILKNSAFRATETVDRFRQLFTDHGIASTRIELLPDEPSQLRHLQTYARIDIALDPFPYHGTTTTCEALWMGVPVITLAGHRHASRVGLSLLSNIGLPDLIATTSDEYVQIATVLAHDLPRLTVLRSTLRERMQKSPLMNAPRFARNVESAYREMWRKWCTTQSLL